MTAKGKQDKLDESTQRKPLRVWPGVLIVALQWLVGFIIPIM